MNCKNATELLSDYVSGQLGRALTVSLENHLATCADCSKEVAGLRWAWSLLDQAPIVETPAFFHENLMSRIAAETRKAEEEAARKSAVWDWRAWFKPRTLAYATACLTLALVTLGGLHVTHASFDPLESILNLFSRPAGPVLELQTDYYAWNPNAQGKGTLEIHLKARPKAGGAMNTLRCQWSVPGQSGGNPQDQQATVTSDKETHILIPLEALPAGGEVTVQVSDPNQKSEAKTLPVTPMLPNTDPLR